MRRFGSAPDSVTIIGTGAFTSCALNSVIIGKGITKIEEYAFLSCNLKNVFYRGSAADWGKITLEGRNTALTYATMYFYSETAPAEEGNYWHYAEDGKTPLPW